MITSEKNRSEISDQHWVKIPEGTIGRFRAIFTKEEDGGFSVVAANLPGVVSEGDTLADAIENIAEAFVGVIASYRESGEVIPWKRVKPYSKDCSIRWVKVKI